MEEKHELTITWNTIFSFIWVVPLSVTVQYRWRAIQTGRWDFVKGDHDRFIEVKITVIKGKQNRDFDYWPLNIGWPLNMVPLNTDSTVYLSHKSSYKPKRGLISTSRVTRIPLARFLINWALYSCSCFPASLMAERISRPNGPESNVLSRTPMPPFFDPGNLLASFIIVSWPSIIMCTTICSHVSSRKAALLW